MKVLADSIPPEKIGRRAYALYEQFRPEWLGWGKEGHLDLQKIRNMARQQR